ncbi:DUF3040 domain-containing protein [Geodermatophilus sp. SYSU D00708]
MDDDPVLRALGEDLAREDPDLAALLSAGPQPTAAPRDHGRVLVWLAFTAVLTAALAPVLLGPMAFGLLGIAVLATPLLVCHWLLSPSPPEDDPPPP